MGCDIHPIIERLQKYTDADGEVYMRRWHNAGTPDLGRNYELFAALAGVRNHDGVEPLSEPRGLPGVTGLYDDGSGLKGDYEQEPCSEFEAYFLSWHGDAHSASWATLAEVKAYETNQWLNDRSIVERDPDGSIAFTCRGTSRPGPYEYVGERQIFKGPFHRDGEPTAWDRLIEEMERAKRAGDTDADVRLVFFFDN